MNNRAACYWILALAAVFTAWTASAQQSQDTARYASESHARQNSGTGSAFVQNIPPRGNPGGVTFIAPELLGRPTTNSVTVNAVSTATLEVYFEYGVASSVYTSQTGGSDISGWDSHRNGHG